jgi:LacI family transcriptional regulator
LLRGAAHVHKRPTLSDVARSCGVTAATVSRVLNHKRDNNFSTTEELRQKILAASEELGYKADINARSLSIGQSSVVGLFASPKTHVAEGINEALIEGIVETLHSGGYEVFFEMTPMHKKNHRLPQWRFDGAVLMQDPKTETVMELDVRGVPYVCVNERVGQAVAYVLADDVMGMNRAISHLMQLGHRRFAYANVRVSVATHYSVFDRYNTLLEAASNGTIELVDGHEMPFDSPSEFLQSAVIRQGATAIIAYDHRGAIRLLGAAHQMGLRVPEDFSLISFNDVFPVALLCPALTVVSVPGREMGRLGGDLLLNHLISPREKTGKEVRVAEDLIVRGSTGPLKT